VPAVGYWQVNETYLGKVRLREAPSGDRLRAGWHPHLVPQVDLIEETYIAAAPDAVAATVHAPAFAADLWPDLDLTVFMDRGVEGVRWTAAGPLTGSCEVWLEPHGDGVIVHTFVRCDFSGEPFAPRAAGREIRDRARHAKRVLWRVKDRLEAGRAPGEPAVGG
jgi:hypothetical protein